MNDTPAEEIPSHPYCKTEKKVPDWLKRRMLNHYRRKFGINAQENRPLNRHTRPKRSSVQTPTTPPEAPRQATEAARPSKTKILSPSQPSIHSIARNLHRDTRNHYLKLERERNRLKNEEDRLRAKAKWDALHQEAIAEDIERQLRSAAAAAPTGSLGAAVA